MIKDKKRATWGQLWKIFTMLLSGAIDREFAEAIIRKQSSDILHEGQSASLPQTEVMQLTPETEVMQLPNLLPEYDLSDGCLELTAIVSLRAEGQNVNSYSVQTLTFVVMTDMYVHKLEQKHGSQRHRFRDPSKDELQSFVAQHGALLRRVNVYMSPISTLGRVPKGEETARLYLDENCELKFAPHPYNGCHVFQPWYLYVKK